MTLDVFLALLAFAFVSSVTPGPNNMMLMASGVNFGFRRTIPHMLGIAVGFVALLLSVGFVLGGLLAAYPALEKAMKWLSAAYLLWLAWKIASARGIGTGKETARPMTFTEAALFQWVNPKAWTMALAAMGAYTNATAPGLSVLIVSFAFGLVNFPSVSVWTTFGVALRSLLANPRRLRIFNVAMGVLLVASLWPMLRH
ncbi:LysE family translocator [Aureimonas leprariae]|uniref:LysE family translocator n=1 Tax=Plantimonas leprariae TaxID=2615207 RepID=A0A7V7PSA8_9HYPH|nr:LysE family translocator [Aureimonas leprariae]KAB0681922.1 LysE family translocator [Aureimonas leprariae]